jgi:C-terminal processing protease CtpA/Prc
VLDTNSAGQLIVLAVSSTASKVTRRNILPGDVIVRISGVDKAPHSLTEAAEALSGAVGEHKQLQILRDGKSMSVTVVVARVL